jgi:hypothetical protein
LWHGRIAHGMLRLGLRSRPKRLTCRPPSITVLGLPSFLIFTMGCCAGRALPEELTTPVAWSAARTVMYGVVIRMQVIAQAYDNPIPGFNTPTTSNLRLWDALPIHEFDLGAFNAGDYDRVRRHRHHYMGRIKASRQRLCRSGGARQPQG